MATRNLAREQDTLKSILESPENQGAYVGTPGADITQASPATRQLLQEGINLGTYGSAAGPRDVQGRIAEMQRQVQSQRSSSVDQALGRTSTGTLTGAEGTAPAATTLPSTDDVYSRYGLTENRTREEIEQDAIDAIQGQLAGIEERYASTLASEAVAGEGRQARGRGLSFASGTQYSPFAETRATEIDEYNRGVVSAIEADRAAEIANLYAAARGEATEAYENQAGRAMEMAESYINQMTTNYQLSLQEQQMMFDQARQIADMTGEFGGSPTLEMLQWVEQMNQQQSENARSNAYLEIAQQQAAAAGREIIQLGNTYYEYDPALGFDSATAIYTEPARSGAAVPAAPSGFWTNTINAAIASGSPEAYYRDMATSGNFTQDELDEYRAAFNQQLEYQSQYGGGIPTATPSRFEQVEAPVTETQATYGPERPTLQFGDIEGSLDYLQPYIQQGTRWLGSVINPY